MPGLVLPAPAKINLVLEILGRRDDGFHALETVFQTLELADEVAVEVRPGDGIALVVEGADLPTGPDNLAWRAAAAYLARHPLGRVAIHLRKRVPHGAGLGGGSSDAAAVLRALARLDPDPLAPAELAAIALVLGSDVPFFLVGGTAHALGRGEELTPLPDAADQPVTILKPPAGCPTPAVFRALSDAERGPRPARGPAAWAADLAARGPAGILANRMTAAAVRVEPTVGALLSWLADRGVPHLLSGSGSACLALGTLDPPPGITAWRTRFRPRARLDATD
jgi:4-diphosphocytidyl-2-C-methyl-D-erythritol kinase